MSFAVFPAMRRITRTFNGALLVAIVMVMAFAVPAFARPGDLDPTFSGDGVVRSDDFAAGIRDATDMAVQSDGKILVVGSRGREPTKNIAVWRLTPDGLPDTTFSGDGVAVADFGGSDEGEELALMSDGRIAVVGASYDGTLGRQHLALAVLTSKGRLDTSFSGDGRVLRGGVNDSWGYGVAVDGANSIVIAGSRTKAEVLALFRYTSRGAIDRSFGGTGEVNVPSLSANVFSDYPEAVDVTIQPDGRILGLGIYADPPWPAGQADCGVVRLMPDGELDGSFSGDGVTHAGFSGTTLCSGIALSPANGKITVAGGGDHGTGMLLARFRPNGELDPNFDLDGHVAATLGVPEAGAVDVVLQGEKTIAVGRAIDGDYMWAIARFTARGQLDTATFGDAGRVFSDLTSCCSAEAAIGAAIVDGKLVVVGSLGSGADIAVARYLVGDV